MSSFQTVIGTDGVAPYYNPNDRWTTWSVNEIFTGTVGKDKYIPKIDDYVVDPASFSVYKVTSIDFTTYLVQMVQIKISDPTGLLSGADRLLSPTVTDISNTYRIYYDNTVTPASLSVDARLLIYSNRATYAKFFSGVGVTDPSKTISIYYDNSGSISSDSIPLGEVAYDNTNNYYSKIIPTFFTNYTLLNGDQVTVVIYDANGSVVATQILVVAVVTGFVQATGPKKYITGLGLDSSYNSDTLIDTIAIPSNLNIRQVAMRGVVNYSDGSTKIVDISPGSNFYVFGLDQFDSKQFNTPLQVVLKYVTGVGEGAVGNLTYDNKSVTGMFNIVSVPSYVSSVFNIYGYPVWIDDNVGYGVVWYLMSGSRNVFFNITKKVNYSSNSQISGTSYNNKQVVSVSVNSNDVSNSLPGVFVSGQVGFLFNSPSNPTSSPFLVYENNGSQPDRSYGLLLKIKSLDNSYKNLDITSGITDLDTWLGAVYYNTQPVINSDIEVKAPKPTHFEILYTANRPTSDISSWADQLVSSRYEIGLWNTPIYIPTTLFFNATVIIKFLTINGSSNSVLGACSLLVQ